jgi:hypothetical protein
MAGATFVAAAGALKEFYLPGAREQLNNDIPFLNQIERNTEDVEGLEAYLSAHVSRNSGVGARAEGGTLPSAGNQGWTPEKIPLKYNYARIQLSGPIIKAMRSDRGSFVRITKAEMTGAVNDAKREVSRQLWMNGDGKIATCGTTTTTNVIQLAAATTAVQMRFFAVGDKVDVGTVAAPQTIIGSARVTAVDTANLTITVLAADGSTPSLSTTASHFVFRQGNNVANATNEVTGMQKIVAASGSLHNIDPATYSVWASRVDPSVGSLSETKMASHVMNVQILSGKYPKLFICDDGSFRAYGNLLTSLKRSNNTQKLSGGYSGLDFDAAGGPMKVVWDRDAPYGCMFSVNPDQFAEYRAADWEWMDADGNILSRVSGVDAYEATMVMYHELGTDERNAHGLMSGVTTA